jgi:hypothetical protein
MKTIMVRYKTNETHANTNADLVRAVFSELAALAPAGVKYATSESGMTKNEEFRATKTEATFRMACAINTTIRANAARVWELLTDAAGYPRWNSTVTSLEGQIAAGQTLKRNEAPSS